MYPELSGDVFGNNDGFDWIENKNTIKKRIKYIINCFDNILFIKSDFI